MCNAWNHAAGCRCGWGGDGHQGRGGGHGSRGAYREVRYASAHSGESFCRPSKCPRCGETPVYFIRHNGGSFWVDEPGWPWEKHGCFADDPTHTRLRTATRRFTKPQPGLVVECVYRPNSMTDLLIVEGERGKRYLVQVAPGADLQKLAGELVIVSVPDNILYHPQIPLKNVVKVATDGPPVPPRPFVDTLRPLPKPPQKAPNAVPVKPVLQKPASPTATKLPLPPAPTPLSEKETAELLRQVNDTSAHKRATAISALAKHKVLKATGVITRRLFDTDAEVREQAARACAVFGFLESAALVIQMAPYPSENWVMEQIMQRLRHSMGKLLREPNDEYRLFHGLLLIGQLRLTSFIPALVSLCQSSKPVALRRTAVETLWRFSVPEAIPLLLVLAVDSDPVVRRIAAAALADLEEMTLCQELMGDRDEEVRQQAQFSFQACDAPAVLTPQFRLPLGEPPTFSPLGTQDAPVSITADLMRSLVNPLLHSGNSAKEKAGIAALLWAGGASAYPVLKKIAHKGCRPAVEALKDYFGVEPAVTQTPVSNGFPFLSHSKRKKKTKTVWSFPEMVRPNAYQNGPQQSLHPVFREPLPVATVLVLSSEPRQNLYLQIFESTNVVVLWRSGFAPKRLSLNDIEAVDAVVLVRNEVSVDTYHHLLKMLQRVGNPPCAYSQSPGVVSVARTVRSLLGARDTSKVSS